MPRTLIALIFALGLASGLAPRQAAAGVVGPLTRAITAGSGAVERASFWARPFPYGYSGWRGCRHHRVRVETPYGWRWRRVCI